MIKEVTRKPTPGGPKKPRPKSIRPPKRGQKKITRWPTGDPEPF